MKLLIITHTLHWEEENAIYAYGPYVREMNIWCKYANEVAVVAPLAKKVRTRLDWIYDSSYVSLKRVPAFSFINLRESLLAIPAIFISIFSIWRAMLTADHIHLRCPGNMGLLGCFVQILFPGKRKTAKYAGNWDPKSPQPLSYRMQKWLLSSTFFSKNMKVIVYGEWENPSKNVLPFFTASYSSDKSREVIKDDFEQIRVVFVGSLVSGKQPLYAISLIKHLANLGFNISLDIYGDGILKETVVKEISGFTNIKYHGSQGSEVIEKAFEMAHFVILPSKSEGWPKVVAEGMFFGAVPLVTDVSCVPWMLRGGSRGVLLRGEINEDLASISAVLNNFELYTNMSQQAQKWSQQYTLESFESAIKELIL